MREGVEGVRVEGASRSRGSASSKGVRVEEYE